MCMPMRVWVYACVFTCPCVYMWTCVMWTSQGKGRCLPPSLAWHLLFETKSPLESGAHWSVSWALGPRGLLVFSSHAHPARAVLQPHTTKSDFYWGLGSHSGPHAFAASSLPVESSCQSCSMGFDKWMVSTIPVLNLESFVEWLGSPVGCPSGFIFHGEILRLDLLFQGFSLLGEAWHFYSRVLEHTL